MNGSYEIQIRSKPVNYTFTIKRKITVIRGDSGTGKTTLIEYLGLALRGIGVALSCEARCAVISGEFWKLAIEQYQNSILFFDETASFVKSKEFAEVVSNSDNYFVLVNRADISLLPYSMDEIYEIKNSGKYNSLVQVYKHSSVTFKATAVITEDSRSGNQFFRKLCQNSSKCITAGGKDNFVNTLRRMNFTDENILIFADAAAFGPCISRLRQYIESDKSNRYFLFAPESFEYLLLSSEMFSRVPNIKDKIERPENYITPAQRSWENYYFDLIRELTAGTNATYKKDSLNQCYLLNCCWRHNECDLCVFKDKVKVILGRYYDVIHFTNTDESTSNVKTISWFD